MNVLATFPRVTICLATLNGARYLRQQLESLLKQDYPYWDLVVSDDGSEDETWAILEAFKARHPRKKITLLHGPRRGYAANFLSLICRDYVGHGYYAFCDQDDIWHPTKLSVALKNLQQQDHSLPALYCGRTRIVDARGRELGFSPKFTRKPSFKNAVVQNIGGGNTMVFNEATRLMLKEFGPEVDVVSHDWWTYIAVTACGGHVTYDAEPRIDYRSHPDNTIGRNTGPIARAKRIVQVLNSQFTNWNNRNLAALLSRRDLLTEESLREISAFAQARAQRGMSAMRSLRQADIYRQTGMGTASLYLACFCGKV